MNSLELYKILKQNNFCRYSFLGVFPSDRCPGEIKKFPSSFILNIDKSGGEGSHWMAVFIPNSHTFEFFDSFGRPQPSSLKMLMSSFTHKNWNKVKLQNDSDILCGPFVLFFPISRCKGLSFNSIVDILRRKTYWRDSFVKLFTAHLV